MGRVDPSLRGLQTPKLKGAGQRPSAKTTGVWSSGATGCWRHWRTNWLRTCACGSVSAPGRGRRGGGERAGQGQPRVGLQLLYQGLPQGAVAVRGFDEDLRLASLQGDALQLLD